MKIALIFDLRPTDSATPDEERFAELESLEAVQGLAGLLESVNHDVHLVMTDATLVPELCGLADHIDIAFNYSVGYGFRSREAHVPSLCELLGVPYTGSDAMTLSVSSNKAWTKVLAQSIDVPTPGWRTFRHPPKPGELRDALPEEWRLVILKPSHEGSSIGLRGPFSGKNYEAIASACAEIHHSYGQPLIIEEFIPGFEVTVPVLGTEEPFALPPVLLRHKGVIPPPDFLFSGTHKLAPDEVSWTPRLPLPQKVVSGLKDYAVQMHGYLGCRGWSRSDFRVLPSGSAFFLEINPTPQITLEGGSLVVSAAAAQLTVVDLLERLLEDGFRRHSQNQVSKNA